MIRRRFFSIAAAAVLSAALQSLFSVELIAQSPPGGQLPRPQAESMKVPQVSPRMMQILQTWERSSKGIQKLEGEHQRYIYDTVFEVEKRSQGYFYYESPDHGRIDIQGMKIPAGSVSRRLGKSGQPFQVESDQPVRWICNGKEVMQINDAEKKVELISIPPQAQGQNIMDGPLPFLFGMPAEQAVRRYELQLLKDQQDQIWLSAKPLWRQDAANYREAKIILSTANNIYLPTAVQLVDPSGNLETVYTFSKLKVNSANRVSFWPEFLSGKEKDPFSPDLSGYKLDFRQDGVARMPSLSGQDWKLAKANLEAAGYSVKLLKGVPAPDSKLVYTIYKQEPAANAPLPPKTSAIEITLYDQVQEVRGKPPANGQQP